jgi:hypothetical protein
MTFPTHTALDTVQLEQCLVLMPAYWLPRSECSTRPARGVRAKLQVRVAILNRFTQLGTPVTVRLA